MAEMMGKEKPNGRGLRLVLGLLAMVFLARPALAQVEAGANSGQTDLTFCNKTGAAVFIALVYYQSQTKEWVLSAWHNRKPGECASIGRFRSGLIYYFAEKEGRKEHWPARDRAERMFCVPSKPIKRVVLSGQTCGRDERLLGFRGLDAKGAKFTFNLTNG